MNDDSELNEPSPRVTKGALTRTAIMQAAKRVIAIDGFAGMKVADVMAAVGKSPGAFYVHFKSKEALLHELLAVFQHRLRVEVNAPLRADEDPSAHLENRLRTFWRIYREDWPIATAAFQMSMADKQFARAWHNIRQQGIRGFAAVVRAAQKSGGSVGLDPELVASAVTSMIEYACYNWTAATGDFPDRFIDDETAIGVLSHLVLQALRGSEVPLNQ
ncbi:TetR/AcrR family transcriptional regulator [Acidovorax sp. ACV02]|uniref:TetR/AcrR family transcriptional regulator n=1 Tax=Acidovorax sp. ACV02 TaxID=2769310 RepID=UPI001782F0E7|nr:TetR/AcrR family transcriptional regulator [Acidovorax sp. ACV02]MBD9408392.1 TetR/AcrR family transcriptional regulator [Acidovorax sp. ACV02]